MSETPVCYNTVTIEPTPATIDSTELYTMRAELETLERRLIPLLIAVQRALGKEPSIITRTERRRR